MTHFIANDVEISVGVWDGFSGEHFLKIKNEYDCDSKLLAFTKDKLKTFLGQMVKMILDEGIFGDYIYLVGRDEGFRFDYREEYVLLAYYDNLGGESKRISVQSDNYEEFVAWLQKTVKEL